MIGQTAPINHTRDGLPFSGTVITNRKQTDAAQGIFQPVPKRMVIDKGNAIDTIRNRTNNQPTALPPRGKGAIALPPEVTNRMMAKINDPNFRKRIRNWK